LSDRVIKKNKNVPSVFEFYINRQIGSH